MSYVLLICKLHVLDRAKVAPEKLHYSLDVENNKFLLPEFVEQDYDIC